MMENGEEDKVSELHMELESLEAIFLDEIAVKTSNDGTVDEVEVFLQPATGHDTKRQFVCMKLILKPPNKYPDEVPDIEIRNPRGLAEEDVKSLLEDMRTKADESLGFPMLFTLIEMAKDVLTEGNVPHCPCVLCLEHFDQDCAFLRTPCYHYFHTQCLARYIQHTLAQHEAERQRRAEEDKKHHKDEDQEMIIGCPVCREPLDEESASLTLEEEQEEKEEPFVPSPELQALQQEMAERLERQRAMGGIIDLEAERNKFLINPDTVVTLATSPASEGSGMDNTSSKTDDHGSEKGSGSKDRGSKSSQASKSGKRGERKGVNENRPSSGRPGRGRGGGGTKENARSGGEPHTGGSGITGSESETYRPRGRGRGSHRGKTNHQNQPRWKKDENKERDGQAVTDGSHDKSFNLDRRGSESTQRRGRGRGAYQGKPLPSNLPRWTVEDEERGEYSMPDRCSQDNHHVSESDVGDSGYSSRLEAESWSGDSHTTGSGRPSSRGKKKMNDSSYESKHSPRDTTSQKKGVSRHRDYMRERDDHKDEDVFEDDEGRVRGYSQRKLTDREFIPNRVDKSSHDRDCDDKQRSRKGSANTRANQRYLKDNWNGGRPKIERNKPPYWRDKVDGCEDSEDPHLQDLRNIEINRRWREVNFADKQSHKLKNEGGRNIRYGLYDDDEYDNDPKCKEGASGLDNRANRSERRDEDLSNLYVGYGESEEVNWDDEVDPYTFERRHIHLRDLKKYDEYKKADREYYDKKFQERVAREKAMAQEEMRISNERERRRKMEEERASASTVMNGKSILDQYKEKQKLKGESGSLPSQSEDNETFTHSHEKTGRKESGKEYVPCAAAGDIQWVGAKDRAPKPSQNLNEESEGSCPQEVESEACLDAWNRRQARRQQDATSMLTGLSARVSSSTPHNDRELKAMSKQYDSRGYKEQSEKRFHGKSRPKEMYHHQEERPSSTKSKHKTRSKEMHSRKHEISDGCRDDFNIPRDKDSQSEHFSTNVNGHVETAEGGDFPESFSGDTFTTLQPQQGQPQSFTSGGNAKKSKAFKKPKPLDLTQKSKERATQKVFSYLASHSVAED